MLVGHNFRFDASFLDAALLRRGADPPREPPGRHARSRPASAARTRSTTSGSARSPATCTLSSSRAIARSATPDATAEVLHALLERAGTFGVLGLDDLLALPRVRVHPTTSKLRLTARVPRRPRRVPPPGPRRHGPLRRAGRQPPRRGAGALPRGPPGGAPARARDRGHRLDRVRPTSWRPRCTRRGSSARFAPRFNRSGQGTRRARAPQAHPRAVPPARGRPQGASGRGALLRAARLRVGGPRPEGRDRGGGAAPPLHDAAPPRRRSRQPSVSGPRRPRPVPLHRPWHRRRVRPGRRHRHPRARRRARRSARRARPPDARPRRIGSARGRGRTRDQLAALAACCTTSGCSGGCNGPGRSGSSRPPGSSSSSTACSPTTTSTRPTSVTRPTNARWSHAGSPGRSPRAGRSCSSRRREPAPRALGRPHLGRDVALRDPARPGCRGGTRGRPGLGGGGLRCRRSGLGRGLRRSEPARARPASVLRASRRHGLRPAASARRGTRHRRAWCAGARSTTDRPR